MIKFGWESIRTAVMLLVVINFSCACYVDSVHSATESTIWLVISTLIALAVLIIETKYVEKTNDKE